MKKNKKLLIVDNIESIEQLKWYYRPIVISGHKNMNNLIFQYSIDLLDRDIILINFNKGKCFIENQTMNEKFNQSVKTLLNNHLDGIYLIGRDGELKHSYTLDVNFSKIFSDIDKMYMRKQEIKNKIH